ncbi:MAG: hypothetical protein K2H64_03700 [Desulfovibrio sp.]|nr:hypothetical protein [Desulfovibrio sp.]
MIDRSRISWLYDGDGVLTAALIPIDEWRRYEASLSPKESDAESPADAMEEFGRFMASWDYRYDYDPAVACPVCSAATKDWRDDPERPFTLKTASLGGTLLFRCNRCEATVRHKYFRYNFETDAFPASN